MEEILIQTKSLNLTDEQFFQLCIDNKGIRFERDKNKNIIIMAPTGGDTSNSNIKLGTDLELWNRKNKLGYCFESNGGFTLPNGAIRSADVAWIPKEKWENLPREDRKRFPHICPDFVIELMSETDSLKRSMEKMEEWMENGCRLGFLIDTKTRITHVYKPNIEISNHPFTETLSGLDVLPGFELKLADIIAD